MARSIWVGFEPREADAFAVCVKSITRRLSHDIEVRGVVLEDLIEAGKYCRPLVKRMNAAGSMQLWDEASEWWMSTEFAISRFFVPMLAKGGYALFLDCDMLARADLVELFKIAESDPSKAVWCVQHSHSSDGIKMDGQVQTSYARKNWSSVMVFNVEHPSNKVGLTFDALNDRPGRDLHRFFWLQDNEIGALPPEWNYLVGHMDSFFSVQNPKLVHFTDGVPSMKGYENCDYAFEWRAELNRWGSAPDLRL